jgi:hypothetical protein
MSIGHRMHIKIFLFCLFLFFSLAKAKEDTHSSPKEKSEQESKEDKSSAADAAKSVKNQIATLESDIADLKSRSQLSQTLINQLLAKKQTLPEKSPEIKLIITQVNEEYVKLKNMSTRLNEKLNELRYKYPERAASGASSGKVKEIKQMEEDVIFSEQLKKTVEHIKKQYGYKTSTKAKKKNLEPETNSEKQKESNLFENPVIIDK